MSGPPELPYAIKVDNIYLNIAMGKTNMQKQMNAHNMFVLYLSMSMFTPS